MASSLSVGGLVSGLDTDSIITGLLSIEQSRISMVEKQQQELRDQRTAYSNLSSKLSTLASKADALSDIDTFNLFTSSSNDEDIATVEGTNEGTGGSFDVVVNKLATSMKVASQSFSSTTSSLGLTGTFELSRSKEAIKNDPSETTSSIEIKSTDALKDIVSKINAAEGTGVKASILSLSNGENRIVLTSVDQGSEGFFLRETSGDVLTSGLGLLSTQQSSRTDFGLMTQDGFAAKTDTLFQDLFTNIGGNDLDAGDSIHIEGMDANGVAVSGDFTFDPATSKVEDLLQEIRNTFGADTSVSLNQSGEIVLTNQGAGTGEVSMNLSFVDAGASSSMTLGSTTSRNHFVNQINEGTNAFYTLDGMAITSQSNTDDSTVVGAEFHLKKADPSTIVKLNLEVDKDGVKTKISEFVQEFNSVIQYIDSLTSVDIEDDDDSKSSSLLDKEDDKKGFSTGPLASDSRVRRLRSQLMGIMTNQITELSSQTQFSSLSRIGITTDRESGLLSIDDDDLEDAIETDFEGIKSLFATTGFSTNPQHTLGRYNKYTKSGTYEINADTDEFDTKSSASETSWSSATRVGDILISKSGSSKGLSVTAAAGSGSGTFTFSLGLAGELQSFIEGAQDSVDGFFTTTDKTYQRRISDYDERILRLEVQMQSYEDRLTRQFASLEQTMQQLQSQNSAFLSQLS